MSDIPQSFNALENPPVAEVALGAVFAPLEKLRAIHFGLFWQQLKEEFPTAEQQPPIPRMVEQIGDEAGNQSTTRFSFPFAMAFPFGEEQRNTLRNRDRSRLIQLQRDRFVTNWIKASPEQKYPGYREDLRPTFQRRWKAFCEFLSGNDLGAPKVDQVDIEYVNDIPQGAGWESIDDLRGVIAPWSGTFSHSGVVPPLSSLSVSADFTIPDRRGRVYIGIQPITVPTNPRRILRLSVSARIIPTSGQADDILDLMDLGHSWTIKTFFAFTARDIQERWSTR